MKRTIISLTAAAALSSLAMAQSDGRSFDAAVELVPGMTVERSGTVWGGDYSRGLLQHGDVVRTDAYAGSYIIVTSDGSVISMNSNSEIFIDGSQRGFDVFQVSYGSANLIGNAYNGYPVNSYFRNLLGVSVDTSGIGMGTVTTPTVSPNQTIIDDTPAYVPTTYSTGYVYGPAFPAAWRSMIPTVTSYNYWNQAPWWSSTSWPGWPR